MGSRIPTVTVQPPWSRRARPGVVSRTEVSMVSPGPRADSAMFIRAHSTNVPAGSYTYTITGQSPYSGAAPALCHRSVSRAPPHAADSAAQRTPSR